MDLLRHPVVHDVLVGLPGTLGCACSVFGATGTGTYLPNMIDFEAERFRLVGQMPFVTFY